MTLTQTVDSRCGLHCTGCEWKQTNGCGGCIETDGHPFHGECPVAKCCQDKELTHCGECADIPCNLLSDYSCDAEHGDTPHGQRITQCKHWQKIDELMKKAEQMLAKAETMHFATVSADNAPRVCAVSVLRAQGNDTLYFSTGTESVKIKHLRDNPNASACIVSGGDSQTLVGTAAVVEDMEVKKAMWQPWMIDHFPGGPEDPGYCVVKFKANVATLWIDRIFETVQL